MDIGDLLYIAFVLFSVVIGIFGKKKKKKQPNNSRDSQAEFNLEDFLKKAYNLDEEPVETQPAYTPPVEPTPETTVQPTQNFTSENRYQKLQKETSKKRKHAEKLKSKIAKDSPIILQEISDEPGIDFEFNAREAIIYSEILKRPQF